MEKTVMAASVFVALSALSASAATLTWVGGDGDWGDASNWQNGQGLSVVPAAGDDVVIQSDSEVAITLASSTPALSSLTIGGGAATNSICVTNWNACIEAASVKIAAKGLLTCQGAFEKADMGRVWIRCTDLDIAVGGAIDVSGRGYLAPGKVASGFATGYGPGAAAMYAMGATHGGVGGVNVYTTKYISMLYLTPSYGNVLYDNPEAPVEPGSSGLASHVTHGGNGGGAVLVEATGRVSVAGKILASGDDAPSVTRNWDETNWLCTAGAGGSVYITCNTFAGTNGIIRADGGDGHFTLTGWYPYDPRVAVENRVAPAPANYGDCVGGGGMIAIHYSSANQTTDMVKDMTISASPGFYRTIYRRWKPTLAESDLFFINGDLGTLHFSDGKLVDSLLGKGLSGRILGFTEWTCDSLNFTNGYVRFQGEGFRLSVSGDLVVTGANSWLDIGGVVITNRVYRPEIWAGQTQVLLEVGGNLSVSGGARLDLRSAETNAPNSWGAVATVGGTMTIGSSGYVYAWCDPVNGGAPKFAVSNLVVSEGGKLTAERRGYAGAPGYRGGGASTYWNYKFIGYGPTPGFNNTKAPSSGYTFPDGSTLSSQYACGGSHGGLGGLSTATNATTTVYAHTSGDEWRPMISGSGAGAGPSSHGNGAGGGIICVEAANHIQVDGEVNADGDKGYPVKFSDLWYGVPSAGGAGGSVFLSAKTFSGASTGVLSAKGGDIGIESSGAAREGAGGGGRIAVWTGAKFRGRMDSPTVQKFMSAAECPDCDFAGMATAAGGTNKYATIESQCATLNGGDGTVRFVHVLPPPGVIFIFK